MITDKQRFRLGFLQKCADAGMTAEEATDFAETAVIIVKEAMAIKESGVMDALTSAGGTLWGAATSLGSWAPPILAGAPLVAGGLIGSGIARATDADDETIKAIRKRELIDEIRRNRLILEQKRRTYRPTA